MVSTRVRPIVTLTTDFGVSSPYVAQMKGVLLSRNPELQVIDVTHAVPPQDVRSAAIVLDDVCRRFPPKTIHVAVIDPGVGTDREIVYARIGMQQFIAPNNGLLTLVARHQPPELLIEITNRLYFLPEVTATFHGRDIMAPVAAHLSLGLRPQRLGTQLAKLVSLDFPEPVASGQQIAGQVLQVDSFGNLVTNILREHLAALPAAAAVRVRCGGADVEGFRETYGERPAGELVALIGSTGRLELAVVSGNASRHLGVNQGAPVVVQW